MYGKVPMLLAAAAIVAYVGVMHSLLGERYVIRRLLQLPDLPLLRRDPAYTKDVLRWAWHLTSVAWWGLAAVLVGLAFVPEDRGRVTASIVSVTLLASGVIVLAAIGRRHPAWALFLAAGAATLIAAV